ncbi:hypothetical protein N8I77_005980 [Diaporthe amygdali]|uniref:C2H2-type domain-containing protein n=1 Tax=Phomopsis amygdali TaxID=1214568 RepID=A0AAD9SGC8_PHOAM|nr:hypothetical protein N8I77_005980 [Diaporthe amygdali]
MAGFDGASSMTPLPENTNAPSTTPSTPSTASTTTQYPRPGNWTSSPEGNYSSDEKYVCDICGKTYTELYKYTKHYRNHAPPLSCPHDACDKKCPQKKDLDRHIRSNHASWAKKNPKLANLSNTKVYKCGRCGYEADRSDNVKRHVDKGTCQKKK